MVILLESVTRKNNVICHFHDSTTEFRLPMEVLYVILCHVITGQGGASSWSGPPSKECVWVKLLSKPPTQEQTPHVLSTT